MNDTYLKRQRHILLDMHIPDWDERFLKQFEPEAFADLCATAGADAVMFYCNSHAGQCYWPTKSGKEHEVLRGQDLVGIMVQLLQNRGIAVCAYYSAVFNTWAYREHPDWRIVPSRTGGAFGAERRYGVCCPNHPGYMDFMLRQTQELADGYPFDGFFFDMLFWPDICRCESCRRRYGDEEGADVPELMDWFSSEWCRFQAARERWLADAFRRLRNQVRASRQIPVFHNGGGVCRDLLRGDSVELVRLNDLFGGDFYARSLIPTIARVTPTVMQYMHNISGFCGGASQLKSPDELKAHAFTATAFGGQFMAIDSVEPDGTVNRAAYEMIADVFAAMKPYEGFLGGTPLADVGVYSSTPAKVDFGENGKMLSQLTVGNERRTPHSLAVEGAVSLLNDAHLPVGVVTKASLGDLDAFPVMVLPNVLRMDQEEVEAFRRYVERGGRLYASGYTSLTTVDGTRHADFLLADVFGCHFFGEETSALTYLKPATPTVADWIAPVQYVTHGEPLAIFASAASRRTALRVSTERDAEVLATVTLPYAGGRGSRDDQGWASIHGSPPWEDTSKPGVVRRAFGRGEVVYSYADIEAAGAELSVSEQAGFGSWPAAARVLFVALIRSLLRRPATFEAEAHPNLWMTAFHDADENQIRLCLLNRPAHFPPLPIPNVRIRLWPPSGTKFASLHRVPTGEPLEFNVDDDGSLHAEIHSLEVFDMLAARYDFPTGAVRSRGSARAEGDQPADAQLESHLDSGGWRP